MVTNPKVFISYSHDNEEHKDWVYKLATDLMGKGIETILDQCDLELGANLPKFMEHGLQDSDRVLVVCTDNYNTKSNEGTGGVGYENNILTAELMFNQSTTKFIPVIRSVSTQMKTPICLASRLYIDFSNDKIIEESFKQLVHEIYGLKLRPKPKLGQNPFLKKKSSLPELHESSTSHFHQLFSSTFPGVRGIEWFEGSTANERLEILLKSPLVFSGTTPVWWWGHGDLQISKFEIEDNGIALMNFDELKIKRISAVNCGAYYQSFVYVETEAMEPTGLYDFQEHDNILQQLGYRYEEYANFKGQKISRSEFDDGAAIIDGKPVEISGEAELRVRYLSPYNFIIAPHGTPINNNRFDSRRRELLKEIIFGHQTVEQLVEEVLKLPKNKE